MIYPFDHNQPLKSADEYYIGILESKIIRIKKKTGRLNTVIESWNI